MKKKLLTLASALLLPVLAMAQGWPANYGGVMLQGFFWDSWTQTPINGPQGGALNYLINPEMAPAEGYTWATMYGAGWPTGEEWQVPLTTWNSLLAHINDIAPYIDLLWLPQSGSTICPPTSLFNKSQDTSGRNAIRAWRNGTTFEFQNDNIINQPDCMGFVPVFYFHHGVDDVDNPWTYTYHWGSYTDENPTNEIRTFTPKSYFGTESELRALISAYRVAGTGAVEDVVANHRGCFGTWTFTSDDGQITYVSTKANLDFPTELYTGQFAGLDWEQIRSGQTVDPNSNEYISWNTDDVCSDDESAYFGGNPTGGPDCGGKGEWARDIQHHNPVTRAKVVKYLDFLRNNLGYLGFRYDYAMGFEGVHYGEYNTTLRPPFSVGEYWGDIANITSWIGSTSMEGNYQSAAFDFPLMNAINQAFNYGNYRCLEDAGMIGDKDMRRYAVTFVDNHDTFKDLPTDGSNYNYQHRTNSNIEEANAFILAMPGTPCLFYPHFMHGIIDGDNGWHHNICNMIKARRAAGVHNMSEIVEVRKPGNNGIAWVVQGTNGQVCFQLGDAVSMEGVPEGFQEIFCTNVGRYSITSGIDWQNNTKLPLITGYPIISRSTCGFSGDITVNVRPSMNDITLVYTTDGTEPDVNSAQITGINGQDFNFTETTQLKVGVLTGNVVQSVVSNTYAKTGDANSVTIYVQADDAPNLYLWSNNKDYKPNGDWAGNKTTQMKTVGGIRWHCKTFPLPDYSNGEYYNLIINWDGNSQSHPITGITGDRYFKYVNHQPIDVTEEFIGTVLTLTADKEDGMYDGPIDVTLTANDPTVAIVYTIDGAELTPESPQATTNDGKATVRITGDGEHVLRAGILVDGQVINPITCNYLIHQSAYPGTRIFVRSARNGAPAPHLFICDVVGTAPDSTYTTWSGRVMDQAVQDDDNYTWYYVEFPGLDSCTVILNNGNSGDANQTEDITGLSGDVYLSWDSDNRYMNVTGLKNHKAFFFFEPSNNNWNTWVTDGNDDGGVDGRADFRLYDKTVSLATGDYFMTMTRIGGIKGGNSIYKWSNDEYNVENNDSITFKRMCPNNPTEHQWNFSNNLYTYGGYYYTDDNWGGDWNNAVQMSPYVDFSDFKYPFVTHQIEDITKALLGEVEKGEKNKYYNVDENLTVGYVLDNALYAFNISVDANDMQHPNNGLQGDSLVVYEDYVNNVWGPTKQRDWVKLTGLTNIEDYPVGSVLSNVTGRLIDTANPTLDLIVNPILENSVDSIEFNTYTPCSFAEEQTQMGPDSLIYFFYRPQVNEVAHITATRYLGNGMFDVSDRIEPTFEAGIRVDISAVDSLLATAVGEIVDFDALITRGIPVNGDENPRITADSYSIKALNATVIPTLPGDVNGDGKVDVLDVTAIINHILGNNPTPFDLRAADVNDDDSINVMDVTLVINIILGIE
ncbi:MAG: chitobiase/beta-hexosaminidase C-terminal domain-containing protein [Muribaculaceae bacterium]|nr:chitobiase/beta-hexosaminidase C-terminal domain-containing protein [Muribaculaceae bacterium]